MTCYVTETVLSRIELEFENGRSWTINDVLEHKIIFQMEGPQSKILL